MEQKINRETLDLILNQTNYKEFTPKDVVLWREQHPDNMKYFVHRLMLPLC